MLALAECSATRDDSWDTLQWHAERLGTAAPYDRPIRGRSDGSSNRVRQRSGALLLAAAEPAKGAGVWCQTRNRSAGPMLSLTLSDMSPFTQLNPRTPLTFESNKYVRVLALRGLELQPGG